MKVDEASWRDVRKYLRYALDKRSFRPVFDPIAIRPQALASAQALRGEQRGPAILVHGVMPRSGTVFVGELLRLHPELHAFPYQLWEFPFLQHTRRTLAIEREFLWTYEQNMDKIGDRDFLALFGASLIAHLHSDTPAGRRVLLKVPSVEHLDYFYHVFPHEHLLVLARDGRDVVQSTLKTWPQLRFSMVCLRWRRAAEMVLACDRRFRDRPQGYWLGRFEDAMREPETFVRAACQRFGLSADRYPFDEMRQIPVRGSSAVQRDGRVTWEPIAKGQSFNPIGRWQQWSPLRKTIFKRIAGRQLIALGYEQDLNW